MEKKNTTNNKDDTVKAAGGFLLGSFDYESVGELFYSMAPSFKYGITKIGIIFSSVGAIVEKLLGIGYAAFVALFVIMLVELVSGLAASRIRGEQLSSKRWSRFGLKVGLWLIILFVTHMISNDFRQHGSEAIAALIDWVHSALILSIFFEYLLSVLENIGVIGGKNHTTLIHKIRDKFNALF